MGSGYNTGCLGRGEEENSPPFCFLRTEEAEHELAGGKTATNRAWDRDGPVRLAQVPTASSEKGAREKHSVGLGRQMPRAVRLPRGVYEVEPHRHPERIASSYPGLQPTKTEGLRPFIVICALGHILFIGVVV